MSTLNRDSRQTLPPLVAGQRLDRATFHERYAAMPPGTRAELIGGVVFMPSPVSREHGRAGVPVLLWLDQYAEETPGVEVLDNVSVFLDDGAEPQPDALLRILPSFGGQSRDQGAFVAGSPELIVEVSRTTRRIDLGQKLRDYERAAVLEYIVLGLDPGELLWHVRQDDRLARVAPDPDGLYRSRVFPGLWLDSVALLARDRPRLRATLDLGLATPEHAAFVARLETMGEGRPPDRPL